MFSTPILLLIFILLISFYFVLRNRIDFLLLFFVSLILYHWQIITGTIWVPPYEFAASEQSVFIVGIVATVLFIFTLASDRICLYIPEVEYNHRKDCDQKNVIVILLVISIVATFYSLYLAGDKIMLNKREFSAAQGFKYDFLYYYPAAMALVYGVASKQRAIVITALFPLLVYLLVGYRAIIVTAIIGSVVTNFYGQRILSLRMLKMFSFTLILYVFFVFYKFSYITIKNNSFDWFAEIIEKDDRFESLWEFFLWGMFSAEFGQVSSNLSLSSSMDLYKHYSFSDAFLGSITGLNKILGYNEDMTRFSHVIREYANPGFSYGLGGTFWGEMYQAGSYAGVFIAATVIIGALTYFNLIFRNNKEKYPLFLFFVSFLAFYIHRNDFTLLLGHLKNHIFLIVLSYLILLLLKGRINIRNFIR